MGRYVNPPGCTKEQWLSENATPITREDFLQGQFSDDLRFVVLVDNGMFTAAGVMFSSDELDYWKDNVRRDTRLMQFFVVETDKVNGVSK